MATVVDAVNTYTAYYPERMIYFSGSTKERTRLYRMAVGLNLEELTLIFDIYAQVAGDENFVSVQKNMDVCGFLVKRKSAKSLV